jgi:hypothetical protein
MRAMIRATRACRWAAAIALGVAAIASLVFALGLLRSRPLLYGEAEVLFEASRLRSGLALYTDPIAGAFDYGPMPARWYVVYPPIWSYVLSFVPVAVAPIVARAAATLAWLGTLAWLAYAADARCRRVAIAAATYVAGVFVVASFATSGRPDSIAVAVSAIALVRSVRRGEVDAVAGALFALAAWIKPNELGLGGGAVLASVLGPVVFGAGTLIAAPRRAWRPLAGALVLSAALALVLHVASRGAWIEHLVRSLGQPLSLDFWWRQMWPRALFAAPIAFVSWLAWSGRRERGGGIALGAFAASLAWTIASLAKFGSASNYWMEPAVGAVVVAAFVPVPDLGRRARALLAPVAVASAVWSCVATLGSVAEAFDVLPKRAALVDEARARCSAGPSHVVLSDTPGVEYAANGRIVSPAFQMAFLAASGKFPVALWVHDVERPEAACLVVEGTIARGAGAFVAEVRAALVKRSVLVRQAAGWSFYELR